MNRTAADNDAAQNLLIGIVVALLLGGAILMWLVGNVAALLGRGRLLHAGLTQSWDALLHLRQHTNDPRLAWAPKQAANLPGPDMYWTSLAIVVIVAVLLFTGVVLLVKGKGGSRHEAVDKRRRLGVPTQARLATTKELKPLLTDRPVPGRFVIARWKSRYLSTEAPSYRRRRGVQGAIAIFGPSQSGKTTGLITGVDAWQGPAVVSSVKTDLLRATLAGRTAAGEVKAFDPGGTTGMSTATWSPLRAAADLRGALAAAQMLARAGGDEGPNDRFWRGQAEQLIAAMLWTAANTEGQSMRSVVKWVLEFDRPGNDRPSTLAPLVRLLTDHADPAIALPAKQVQGWLYGQWSTDPRTTSSVYATARNAVWPWAVRQQHPLPLRAPRRRHQGRDRIRCLAPRPHHPGLRPLQPHRRAARSAATDPPRRSGQHAVTEAAALELHHHRRRDVARDRVAVEGPARPGLRPGR
jgi:type IV secretion system protein VirD4